MLGEQLPRARQYGFRRRAEDSVVTDFDCAAWKHVLEESPDEFDCGQSDLPHLLGTVIAIAETDHAVVDGFKPSVGNGDPEQVASEVVENLIAAAGVLGMNNPSFLPDRYGRA